MAKIEAAIFVQELLQHPLETNFLINNLHCNEFCQLQSLGFFLLKLIQTLSSANLICIPIYPLFQLYLLSLNVWSGSFLYVQYDWTMMHTAEYILLFSDFFFSPMRAFSFEEKQPCVDEKKRTKTVITAWEIKKKKNGWLIWVRIEMKIFERVLLPQLENVVLNSIWSPLYETPSCSSLI